MVVFRGDKNVSVERSNFLAPSLRVRFAVLMHYGRHRLIEERQRVILDIDIVNSAFLWLFRMSCAHFATAAAFRPGRVLPTMIPTFSIFSFSLRVRSSGIRGASNSMIIS